MAFNPLSIVSYPKKGVRNIRISPYTLSRIDFEVFKDENYSLYRSKLGMLLIDEIEDLKLISSFLSIDIKESYINYLIVDSVMCSFSS